MSETARQPHIVFPPITTDVLWGMVSVILPLWFASGLPLLQLDFWWHLKVGQVIVETRQVPQVDLFSFTAQGRPFVYQNWLAEVVFYGLYRVGGLPLLVFSNALLITGAFAVIFILARQAGGSARVAALCTLAAEAASWRLMGGRPQVFSFVMFALTLAVIQNLRQRPTTRRLWLLPLFMALWVNLHGAFVMGFILLAVFWLGEGPVQDRAVLPRLIGGSVLTLLAAGLNPIGYRVFNYVAVVVRDPVSRKTVMEWQPPTLSNPADLPFFALLAGGIAVLIWAERRPRFTDVVLFGAFSALALVSLRNVVWFAMVASPVIAKYLPTCPRPGFWERLQGWMGQHRQGGMPSSRRRWMNYAVMALFVGPTVLLSPWVRPALQGKSTEQALIDPRIPREAIAYIEEHELQGRIFHPQWFGDYMIWRLYPRQRVFVDGRVHLFGEAIWKDYHAIMGARFDWQDLLDKYQIRILLLDRQSQEDAELLRAVAASAQWEAVYTDPIATIYVRRSPGG